jgi:hypothetical protein
MNDTVKRQFVRVPKLESGIVDRWYEDQFGNMATFLKPKYGEFHIHFAVAGAVGMQKLPEGEGGPDYKQVLRFFGEGLEVALPPLNWDQMHIVAKSINSPR